MPNDYPFVSDVDNRWYFWLGNGLQGPFDDYNDAHTEMSQLLAEAHGKEEASKESH
jgi:hypothetical protein